jgi:putative aldouronate transport system substrate-binding protein
VPWRYIAQHPYVQYQADLPGYAKRSFEVEQMLLPEGIQDATSGYYSKTQYSAQGTSADQTFLDGLNDIITSRRPMTDYDQLVKEWRNAAGEQIRTEFTQAMQAAG